MTFSWFSCIPLSSAVTLDEEQWLFPKAMVSTAPLFLHWRWAARIWNSWTNTRDLFLPERGEKQQTVSIFIFSHSFYLPQVCILYTWLRLCLLMWFIFIPPNTHTHTSCIIRRNLWHTRPHPALRDPFHLYEKFKNSSVCIFHTFWLYFSLTTK